MRPPRKKILICGVLPPPTFGHSKMYEMLMASSFPKDFDIRFLNMNFWSYQTNQKVTGNKLLKMLKYYGQFIGDIVTFRPQYVLYNASFYPMPFLKDLLFCVTGIVLGRKVVMHDMGQYARELHDRLPRWQAALLRWQLRRTAASILVGEAVKSAYAGLMPSEKLFAAGIAVEDTREVRVDAARGPGLNVLFFSFMSVPKGIFVAFDAARQVLRADPFCRFTFGGGIASDAVGQAFAELRKDFPGRIVHLGHIEDVPTRTRMFREADVFIFPTLRDASGLVLLHAMAEGLPIVASREGTIPEIVAEGENGFLFDKGDAGACASLVLRLLADAGSRSRMAACSRRRFEQAYTAERYGAAMARVFEKI